MEEEDLAQEVSITELLEDDGKVGEGQCSICLSEFVFVDAGATQQRSNKALISATNNDEEYAAAVLPAAETSESQTVDIPVRLLCGRVFGKNCIRSWLSVCLVRVNQRARYAGLSLKASVMPVLFSTDFFTER